MKDVVLINLPSPFLTYPRALAPKGLLYVAAAIERTGVDVSICDLSLGLDAEPLPPAKVYGISATTPQLALMKKAIKKCMAVNRKAIVMLGGAHVTGDPFQDYGKRTIVCHGETDAWIGAAVADHVLFDNAPIMNCDGGIVSNLDDLPMPAYHLLNMGSYGQSLYGYWCATVIGARGCPGQCSFCSKGVFGNKYRRRSIDNILAEVEILKGRYGYRAIHFLDDALIVNPKDLIALCLGMKQLDMKWKCLLRTDTVVDTLGRTAIQLMADCGCLEIAYGIESGSQEILDRINKHTTVDKNTAAVKWAEAVGIRAKAFLIVGLPGESTDTLSETKRWFEDARPSHYSLSALRPFKGSPIADRPGDFGIKIIDKNPEHYSYRGKDELTSVVETEHLKADELSRLGNDLDKYFRAIVRSG